MDAADSAGVVVALQDGLDLMGERAVADIMEKGESLQTARFICR